MEWTHKHLELQILDCMPDGMGELRCGALGPVGPAGRELYLTGGAGGLLWYDPANGDKGFVDTEVDPGVGLTVEDVDGDGIAEIFVSDSAGIGPGTEGIVMYKLRGTEWARYTVTDRLPGHPHDIVFADIDGDGTREIVTIACYSPTPGVFILKPETYEVGLPTGWSMHTVSTEVFTEGVSVGDLNGDGKAEIVSGPDWYEQPPGGPYAGPWRRRTYAPTYREMCRTALADVTGNGRPDIFITDSEYLDGTLSWYENRLGHDGPQWVEHRICDRVEYSHSLEVRQRPDGVDVFLAEMEQGGWGHPYNADARLLLFSTDDHGESWRVRRLYHGEGTHEATIRWDGDKPVVYGKTLGRYWLNGRVQVWREPSVFSHIAFNHVMIDRDKPGPGTDILPCNLTGETERAVACGKWIYLPGSRRRLEVPGVSQIITAYDLDGDGLDELIATVQAPANADGTLPPFSNELCWLKPRDLTNNEWDLHSIGRGAGDWPHGSLIAPLLPGGRAALVLSYHSANNGKEHYPQIAPVPDDPAAGEWKLSTLAEIIYGEELLSVDINGDGLPDILAGNTWLRNNGDGTFTPFTIASDFYPARIAVADIAGKGRPDVMLAEEKLDFETRTAAFARLAWFECPEDPETEQWKMHIVDSIRSPHSLSAADIDGDGIPELIVGEHDPFWPYRARNRLFIYKSTDYGKTWFRHTIDSRFEHHDGGKLADLGDGKPVILSHGWKDSIYVHAWEIGVG